MIKILNLKSQKIDTLQNQLKEIIEILEQFKNTLIDDTITLHIGQWAKYKVLTLSNGEITIEVLD